MVVNTYGISVGIANIGWKLYLVSALYNQREVSFQTYTIQVYIGWICIELVIIYYFFVETAGKTLEELSEIFEAKNPRKASTKKVQVAMDASGHIVDVKGP
jgi:hypothetical protein